MFDCLLAHRYVEYHGCQQLYTAYVREQLALKQTPVTKNYLYKIWREVMNEGVRHP